MTLDHGSSDAPTAGDGERSDGSGPAPGGIGSADGAAEPRELIDRAERLSPRSSFRVGLLLGIVVTIAAGLLIVQNGSSARLHWAWSAFDAPLWIFLAFTLLAGFVLGLVVSILARRTRRRSRERRTAMAQARSALTDADANTSRSPGQDSAS